MWTWAIAFSTTSETFSPPHVPVRRLPSGDVGSLPPHVAPDAARTAMAQMAKLVRCLMKASEADVQETTPGPLRRPHTGNNTGRVSESVRPPDPCHVRYPGLCQLQGGVMRFILA